MTCWEQLVANVEALLDSSIFSNEGVKTSESFTRIKEGLCFGLTCMWIQAVLCDDEKHFYRRMESLCRSDDVTIDGKKYTFSEAIQLARSDYKTKYQMMPGINIDAFWNSPFILTSLARLLLETPAFIENMLFYQLPYGTSFMPAIRRQDLPMMSKYVVPKALTVEQAYPYDNSPTVTYIENKSMKCVDRMILAGTQAKYCEVLETKCREMASRGERFAIMLLTMNHAIGLSFCNGKFTFFNSQKLNQNRFTLTLKSYMITEIVNDLFSAAVYNAEDKINPYRVCSMEVYVSPKNTINYPKSSLAYLNNCYTIVAQGRITALHMAALNGYYEEMEHMLMIPGAKHLINTRDSDGRTAFFLACSRGRLAIAKLLLLKHKCDPNIRNNSGTHPRFAALYSGYPEIDKELLDPELHPEL